MQHQVVSREDWLLARKAHLAREKAFTRQRDALSAERRALPWVKVDKDYAFEGRDGRLTLADLFGANSQLLIYHFMFGPGWTEGCPGCSFLADHFDGANLHLKHHDVSLVAVSRAPYAEFQPFRKRMGWDFAWVSSAGSDFNDDFHVSPSPAERAAGRYEYNYEMHDGEGGEMPGFSVFYRNEAGEIFHTYSTYARGGDLLIGANNFLDMMPKGRNETTIMDWMRHHDRYEDKPAAKGASEPAPASACCG
ncbi:DUF899 domain-containing protein [Bosea psychrotolerans]|uniref:Putative dithiol-disulfide oxidoreductase (DUF899 family) n=1 Tax=Bosea psychrotolerans TaxID=1871628 RepID=A0A2S4M116_9HYPH|nr:thioredoxin family protein [Bosea psychrotolerans]POR48358.1 putative dithiol-disulfide oxidoreductase (DUF899 family) [Bosea psychrotolerans]